MTRAFFRIGEQAGDGDPMTQPIFLTQRGGQSQRRDDALVRLSGSKAPTGRQCGLDLIILMFDRHDEAALAQARSEWRRLKDQERRHQLLA